MFTIGLFEVKSPSCMFFSAVDSRLDMIWMIVELLKKNLLSLRRIFSSNFFLNRKTAVDWFKFLNSFFC